jgi:hypothetical protein
MQTIRIWGAILDQEILIDQSKKKVRNYSILFYKKIFTYVRIRASAKGHMHSKPCSFQAILPSDMQLALRSIHGSAARLISCRYFEDPVCEPGPASQKIYGS